MLNAISEARWIAGRHPVLFARMSNAGADCNDLCQQYLMWSLNLSTRYCFQPDEHKWKAERPKRRRRGRAQRLARRVAR